MNTKNILRSKTFWVQVITFILALIPASQDWLVANPATALGGLAAINTLVRLVSNGSVTLFSADDTTTGFGNSPLWILGVMAVGLATALPSCITATTNTPLVKADGTPVLNAKGEQVYITTTTKSPDNATIGTVGGLVITGASVAERFVDARSGK